MFVLLVIASIIIGYLMGAIPTSYLVGNIGVKLICWNKGKATSVQPQFTGNSDGDLFSPSLLVTC